jgi:Rps23 Pro-64 3,4-dihydroxylase Tpa1-like proline 4-hydroxylase
MPKPNRLVILKGGVTHRVAPVSQAAGEHVRASIAGFFLRKDALKRLILEG